MIPSTLKSAMTTALLDLEESFGRFLSHRLRPDLDRLAACSSLLLFTR